MSDDEALFEEVGRLVDTRADWHFEPSTTPAGSPSWCLDPGGEVRLSVNVSGGAITLYLPATDQDVVVPSVVALETWLDENDGRFR